MSEHDPKECLRKARVLLTPPGSWQKYRYATDKQGNHVVAENPEAVCFCLMGAVRRVCPDVPSYAPIKALIKDAAEQIGLPYTADMTTATHWNDDPERTHEQVLAMLDAAVAA